MKNVDPVMIMYRKDDVVSDLVNRVLRSTKPVLTASDKGESHSIWAIDSREVY